MKTNSADRIGDISSRKSERRGLPLGRLAELFGRRVAPSTYRMAPPLRNPHYIGVHIAVVSSRSTIR
jgi:hypothetical protein